MNWTLGDRKKMEILWLIQEAFFPSMPKGTAQFALVSGLLILVAAETFEFWSEYPVSCLMSVETVSLLPTQSYVLHSHRLFHGRVNSKDPLIAYSLKNRVA